MTTATETKICPGCGKEIGAELQACWNCFKYRDDIQPLKYFPGSREEWIRKLKQVHVMVPANKFFKAIKQFTFLQVSESLQMKIMIDREDRMIHYRVPGDEAYRSLFDMSAYPKVLELAGI